MSKRTFIIAGAIWFALIIGAGQVWGQGSFTATATDEAIVLPFTGMQVDPQPTATPPATATPERVQPTEPVVVNINVPDNTTREPLVVDNTASDVADTILDIFESVVDFTVLSASAMAFITMLLQALKNLWLLIAKKPLSTTWVRALSFILSIIMIGLYGLLNRAGVDAGQIDITLDSIVVLAGGVLGLVFGSGMMYQGLRNRDIAGFSLGSSEPTKTVG